MLFLRCVAEAGEGHGESPFNHTSTSRIPGNTHACLQRYAVPSATADAIDACVRGPEGAALLAASIARTHAQCGHHSSAAGKGCKSCTMALDGANVCVLDDGHVYNCTGLGADPQQWIRRICDTAVATHGWQPAHLPLACRLDASVAADHAGWPRVHGHSYASTDPRASADFAIRYLGAQEMSDEAPHCDGPPDARPPREVSVRLPHHADYRGGGLMLRFVSNPRKPGGGTYDIARHVDAMHTLYGNLSDNTGHHWNQFFDSHLGFYAGPSDVLAAKLLRDKIPFFTGQSSGVYQSVYVVIPHTAHVLEVLGNWYLPHLPPNHIRFSSTDQFCSPKRRKRRLQQPTAPSGGTLSDSARTGIARTGIARSDGARAGGRAPAADRALSIDAALGVDYHPGGADLNKTTMAGADPRAAIDFAVRYLGGAPIQQHRGAMADGPCTTLSWAEWPDNHEWHVVEYSTADWVTSDQLRPAVPFNISDLAGYIEKLRDLTHGTYDQWLDFREIMRVGNLTAVSEVLRADGVPFGVWARPQEGTCSVYVDLPRNGIAVELTSRVFDGAWLARRCAANAFDLCAAD